MWPFALMNSGRKSVLGLELKISMSALLDFLIGIKLATLPIGTKLVHWS